jgi:hypothetical protein
MKTFDEALTASMTTRAGRSMVVQNMKDLYETVMNSDGGQSFLEFMIATYAATAPKIKKRKQAELAVFGLVMTAFVSGIRVGQEMEKRDL